MSEKSKSIHIAVTEWAQPVPRVGHIESSSGIGDLSSQWGQEIHQEIQSRSQGKHPGGFQAEVPIGYQFKRQGWKIRIRGSIDGVHQQFPPILEEIKSSFQLDRLRARLKEFPNHPYILQLKCYGYFYLKSFGIEPELRLRLVDSRSREEEVIQVPLDLASFEDWMNKRADEVIELEEKKLAHELRRKDLAKHLVFPFRSPRPQQEELMEKVAKVKSSLVLQAPTGMGKTLGVLFPLLKESFSRGQTCVYVTPKNSQHGLVEDALKKLRSHGADIRYVILTAKHKICRKPEPMCGPDYCEYSKNYYAKMHKHQVTEVVGESVSLGFDEMIGYSNQYEVCPFELSLDSLYQFDVIICDYNYVFSPHSILGRLVQRPVSKNKRPNLIVDEAHNLPDRARSYFSPALDCQELIDIGQKLGALPKKMGKSVSIWLEDAMGLIRSHQSHEASEISLTIDHADFQELTERLSLLLSEYFSLDIGILENDPILRLFNYWNEFTNLIDYPGGGIIISFIPNRWGGRLQMTCCDASEFLAKTYPFFKRVVLFSATMKPFRYYTKLCGLELLKKPPEVAEFPSPFPKENRKVLIIPQVSTKLKDRSRHLRRFIEAIDKIAREQAGNYFVFFPSFQFLDLMYEAWDREGFEVLRQTPSMRPDEVKKLIQKLQDEPKNKLFFAVQGGVLSEGIDYPPNTAVGVFIIGPGLPAFTKERELLRQYYEKQYGDGYNFAYVYPAMTKVIQSAGRLIRSEKDKGLIVLMDQRFVVPTYAETLPGDWISEGLHRLSSTHILQDVREFWAKE